MWMSPLFFSFAGGTFFLFLMGLVGNWQLSGHLQELLSSLRNLEGREKEWESRPYGSTHPLLLEVMGEYKQQRLKGVEEINTQALVERHYHRLAIRVLGIFPVFAGGWERFFSFLNGGMVMLGLLGTFIGLTSSIYSMQTILSNFTSQSGTPLVSQIITSISHPFEGMSFAFLTSIVGLGSSFLLTGLSSGWLGGGIAPNPQALRDQFLSECENFLDNHYRSYVDSLKPKGSFEGLMDRFVDRIKESFSQSISRFGESIIEMTGKVAENVEEVNRLIAQEGKIISSFENGAEGLLRFGEEMERTVQALVTNHLDLSSQMNRISQVVEALRRAIGEVGEKNRESYSSLENWIQIMMKDGEKKQEEWDGLKREFQAIREEDRRRLQGIHEGIIRQVDQVFEKQRQAAQQEMRGLVQGMEQIFGELGRILRQQQEVGQKNLESHRYLIERLPALPRTAEEFTRSIENLDRSFQDFLERFRREAMTTLTREHFRERESAVRDDLKGVREMTREMESVRVLLEREFYQSHRFAHEIRQLVEAIYETGRNTLRRSETRVIEGRGMPVRGEREFYEER
ncbi:hypothetical protein [Thermicanus aegyptius]|uniref:hypothetical protein n=1 Tax=Thermicanus aegyptius TaxID=94009 RepID=UPI000417C3C4|nr:hypothetical protein [Thermicanus aegyptius]